MASFRRKMGKECDDSTERGVLEDADPKHCRTEHLRGAGGLAASILQAVFADCEPGGSGRVFASLRHRVIVSHKNPLREQHMYLTQVTL